ncbi:hypothetical protein [Fructobacillus fructosus]|uniref:hypothetical protein n=1 Tax=Fructobacillus fructosus TaxID=1631 RepID=UPI0030C7BB04
MNIGPIDSFVKNSKGNDQHVNFAIVGAYARADANGNPYITIAIGTTQLAGQSIGTRNSFYGYASNGSAKTFQYQYPKEGVCGRTLRRQIWIPAITRLDCNLQLTTGLAAVMGISTTL